RARLIGAIARRGDGDDEPRRHFLGVQITVGDPLELATEGFLRAAQVLIHDREIAFVDLAEMAPLGEEDASVGEQRRRDAVRDVARRQEEIGAVELHAPRLRRGLALVLVAELGYRGALDVAIGDEEESPGWAVDRIHLVVSPT